MAKTQESIGQTLKEAGFELVMHEPHLQSSPNQRPDILGWASDASGSLVPWAVVEVRKYKGKTPHPAKVLQQLAALRSELGTRDHYVVDNGSEWYKADSGLQRLEKVAEPTAPRYGGEGQLSDVPLLTGIIQNHLWRAIHAERGRLAPFEFTRIIPEVLDSLESIPPFSQTGINVDPRSLWAAKLRAVESLLDRGSRNSLFTSNSVIGKAIARMLGSKLTGTIVDPVCGAGSFLWNAIEYGTETGQELEHAIGLEQNPTNATLAQALSIDCPTSTEILNGAFLETTLPSADCVVAAPPFGLRLPNFYELSDGSKTKDIEAVYLDRCIQMLKPQGRAILHLSRNITFKEELGNYRHYLANNLHVAALIGLPSGAFAGTGIPSALLVIDKSLPSETFVAQLGSDWKDQLAPNGAALQAVCQHIDGIEQ